MDFSPARRSLPASVSRILRVSGICAGLGAAALWLLSGVADSRSSSLATSSETAYPMAEFFFSSVESAQIDQVHITFPSGVAHHLRRRVNGWEILDGDRWFPINPDRDAGLFGSSGRGAELARGVSGTLQGSNPANHDRAFGVSPHHGMMVTFVSRGHEVEKFIVGRAVKSSTGWGTYVRRPDSNAVYQLDGKLTDNFSGESVHTWRRRYLFPGVTPAAIQEVVVTRHEYPEGYALIRAAESPTGWRVRSGLMLSEADPQITNALCEWIVRLRTADFLEESILDVDHDPLAEISLRIEGYTEPVRLVAHRHDQTSAIIRLQVDSPREDESGVLGVFDLLPLWRDPAELVWTPAAGPTSIADDRRGANEPFALGAGEMF